MGQEDGLVVGSIVGAVEEAAVGATVISYTTPNTDPPPVNSPTSSPVASLVPNPVPSSVPPSTAPAPLPYPVPTYCDNPTGKCTHPPYAMPTPKPKYMGPTKMSTEAASGTIIARTSAPSAILSVKAGDKNPLASCLVKQVKCLRPVRTTQAYRITNTQHMRYLRCWVVHALRKCLSI
jgi:hypothetical protein